MTSECHRVLLELALTGQKQGRAHNIAQEMRVRLNREEVKELQRISQIVIRTVRERRLEGDSEVEDALRVRLYPLIVTARNVASCIGPGYEAEIGPMISAYFRVLTPSNDRLMDSWEDVCTTLNFVFLKRTPPYEFREDVMSAMKRIADSAVQAGLISTLLTVVSWVDLDSLVKLDLRPLRTDIEREHLSEAFCRALLSRVTDSPHVFRVLLTAFDFAPDSQLRESIASLSFDYLRPFFQSRLSATQRSLLSAIVLSCTDFFLTADIPISLLFSHSDTISAGKQLVRQQIVFGIHNFHHFAVILSGPTVASCFSMHHLTEVILAKRWDSIADLRVETNIDAALSVNMKILLETRAPKPLILFADRAENVRSIKSANITLSEQRATLEQGFASNVWTKDEELEAIAWAGRISRIVTLLSLLFVRNHSNLSRLPGLLFKDVALVYLV